MSHSLISGANFHNVLPAPPEATAAWSACLAHVIEPPRNLHAAYDDHVLALRITGACRVRREVQGRTDEGWLGPGGVNLFPAGQVFTWETSGFRGRPRGIAMFFPREYIDRVVSEHGEARPRSVEIVHRFIARDPVIEGVMTHLAREATEGSPGGSLYAESACEFLAHHLVYAHSSLAGRSRGYTGGLPARRVKLVLDYIEDNVAGPISLRQLAELAGVSARHFERAFRQAVGAPPHAYVLQKRLATARHLLLGEPSLSIRDISRRVGFSSSSHFAHAFRRETGYSPRMFRQLYAEVPFRGDEPRTDGT